MTRFLVGAVMALGLIAFVAPESAAQTPAKGKAAAAAKPTGPGERVLDFEGDVVEAQLLRPDQGVTEAVVRRKRSSLIHVRQDFVDEILKSAEDL